MRYGFDYVKNLDNAELFFREYLGLQTIREDRDSLTVTIDAAENLRNRSDGELKELGIDPKFRKHPERFFDGKDGAETPRIKIRSRQIGFSENRGIYDFEVFGSPANRIARYAAYFVGDRRDPEEPEKGASEEIRKRPEKRDRDDRTVFTGKGLRVFAVPI